MKKLYLMLIFMASVLNTQDVKAEPEEDGSAENTGTIALSQKSLPSESQYWHIGPMSRLLIIPGKNTALFVELFAEKYFIPHLSAYGTLGLGLDISWNKNFPVQQTTNYNSSTHSINYKQSYYIKIPIGAVFGLFSIFAGGLILPPSAPDYLWLFLTDGFSVHIKPGPIIDIAPFIGFFTAFILNPIVNSFVMGPESGIRLNIRTSRQTRISGLFAYQYQLGIDKNPHTFQTGLSFTWMVGK